jgi:hypothetical protein
VYASGKIDFGFPVIDVETELGEKKQQKILSEGELTVEGSKSLIYSNERTLNPNSLDDNCMKCQAQNEQLEDTFSIFCELKDLSASKCCSAKLEDSTLVW